MTNPSPTTRSLLVGDVLWTPRDRTNVDRWIALEAGVALNSRGKVSKARVPAYPHLPSGSLSVHLLEADNWATSPLGLYLKTCPKYGISWSASERSVAQGRKPGDTPLEFYAWTPDHKAHRIEEVTKRGYYSLFHPEQYSEVPEELGNRLKSLFPKRFLN